MEKKIQDQPQKCVKMLMRRIHGGFNQVGTSSEASSDEEEEGSEDEEEDDKDQQPAPSSVINISMHNKKTQRVMNYSVFYWTQEL